MKFCLTFKHKMALVLVLAILGFVVVTSLAISGFSTMSRVLVQADSVARSIGEASQVQLTLLTIADDGRNLQRDNVDNFLNVMDKRLEEHRAVLEKELTAINGSELAKDILWIDTAGNEFQETLHRYADLKTRIGFDDSDGLRLQLIEAGEIVKKAIIFGGFDKHILELQVKSKNYMAEGSPEKAQEVSSFITEIRTLLDKKGMSDMSLQDDISFDSKMQQYSAVFEGTVKPRTELYSVENKIGKLLEDIKTRSTVMKENGKRLLVSSNASAVSAKKSALWLMIAGSTVAGILLCLVLIWISSDFLKSLKQVTGIVDQISDGDIHMAIETGRKDEIGILLSAMDNMVTNLKQVCTALDALSEGDLSFDIETDNEKKDELRKSLLKVRNDLSSMVGQQIGSSQQISHRSVNVSEHSQSLSEGATESAASLEEISSSLSEMSSQTKVNAENASQVNSLSSEAKKAAEEGNSQMERMVAAMADISDAGQSINKIIKVIDEIAFQTNLLALNAAVEAARAGQHGKGFAVVAEEVRNLAARSAKAASETTDLIAGSVEKTKNGVEIANMTANSLEKIFAGVSKVSDLAEEIALASNEQASGIGQINEGLSLIDRVIQQNTSTAQESAASAQDLSSQAAELLGMLKRFKLDSLDMQGTIAYKS